ncbi:hypothetical protein [Candidatus Lokiarchaeum ossiferum]|uniref:hypothetical protein n=1 Tax=Candidatus Lokiarchaeum ossiferum TaxID=2951803 RepID=UPI00352FB4F5
MEIAQINSKVEKILKNSQKLFAEQHPDAQNQPTSPLDQEICDQMNNSVKCYDEKKIG